MRRRRFAGAAAASRTLYIMRCPYCQHMEDRVVDSRSSREGRAVRRRRECLACGRRFTTYEYIEERPLQVIKRSGEVEPYDRRKLLTSITVAAAKRPVGASDIDALVDEIEHEMDRTDATEVQTHVLGEMVMERLKALDHIAYVRFASVYRNFQDPAEFYEELRDLDERSAQRELLRYQRELPLEREEQTPSGGAPSSAAAHAGGAPSSAAAPSSGAVPSSGAGTTDTAEPVGEGSTAA
jgi:transcriptional repressor NrdR